MTDTARLQELEDREQIRQIFVDYAKYLDQNIVVGGTLTRGFRGEHFTDVVMTVKAVNPTGKPMSGKERVGIELEARN